MGDAVVLGLAFAGAMALSLGIVSIGGVVIVAMAECADEDERREAMQRLLYPLDDFDDDHKKSRTE